MEPSTGLVNGLGNKLCRELLLKDLLVFKRIMMLCKRHCAGVKPAVNNLRYSLHGLTTVRTNHGNLINIRSVQFYGLCSRIAGTLL